MSYSTDNDVLNSSLSNVETSDSAHRDGQEKSRITDAAGKDGRVIIQRSSGLMSGVPAGVLRLCPSCWCLISECWASQTNLFSCSLTCATSRTRERVSESRKISVYRSFSGPIAGLAWLNCFQIEASSLMAATQEHKCTEEHNPITGERAGNTDPTHTQCRRHGGANT